MHCPKQLFNKVVQDRLASHGAQIDPKQTKRAPILLSCALGTSIKGHDSERFRRRVFHCNNHQPVYIFPELQSIFQLHHAPKNAQVYQWQVEDCYVTLFVTGIPVILLKPEKVVYVPENHFSLRTPSSLLTRFYCNTMSPSAVQSNSTNKASPVVEDNAADCDWQKWLKEVEGAESLMDQLEAKADLLQNKMTALLAEMAEHAKQNDTTRPSQ